MGLFRGLLILVVGIFYIQLTNKFKKQIENVPLVGKTMKTAMEDYKEYMLVITLALTQLIL